MTSAHQALAAAESKREPTTVVSLAAYASATAGKSTTPSRLNKAERTENLTSLGFAARVIPLRPAKKPDQEQKPTECRISIIISALDHAASKAGETLEARLSGATNEIEYP